MREHPGKILRGEPVMPGGRRRDEDSVERLRLPQTPQCIDGGPAALDASVHGDTRPPRRKLNGFQNRHCTPELLVLDRCIEAELERDDQQVGGDEHCVLGASDSERGIEHCGVELAIGKRD
jgi:hypothetical protein